MKETIVKQTGLSVVSESNDIKENPTLVNLAQSRMHHCHYFAGNYVLPILRVEEYLGAPKSGEFFEGFCALRLLSCRRIFSPDSSSLRFAEKGLQIRWTASSSDTWSTSIPLGLSNLSKQPPTSLASSVPLQYPRSGRSTFGLTRRRLASRCGGYQSFTKGSREKAVSVWIPDAMQDSMSSR